MKKIQVESEKSLDIIVYLFSFGRYLNLFIVYINNFYETLKRGISKPLKTKITNLIIILKKSNPAEECGMTRITLE